jgi:hypothetical protein
MLSKFVSMMALCNQFFVVLKLMNHINLSPIHKLVTKLFQN